MRSISISQTFPHSLTDSFTNVIFKMSRYRDHKTLNQSLQSFASCILALSSLLTLIDFFFFSQTPNPLIGSKLLTPLSVRERRLSENYSSAIYSSIFINNIIIHFKDITRYYARYYMLTEGKRPLLKVKLPMNPLYVLLLVS